MEEERTVCEAEGLGVGVGTIQCLGQSHAVMR